MKHLKLIILSFFLLFVISVGYSQSNGDLDIFDEQDQIENIEFNKKNFPDRSLLKFLNKNIKKGDKLFYADPPDYYGALKYYLNSYEINENNASLNYKVGKCVFSYDKLESITYLQKAKNLFKNYTDDNFLDYVDNIFLLAQVYHYKEQFSEAKNLFETVLILNKKIKDSPISEHLINTYINQCDVGIELSNKPLIISTSIINKPIPNNTEDVFHSYKLLKSNTNSFINNNEFKDATLTDISSDGNYSLFVKNNNIYYSVFENNTWTNLKSIGNEVNTNYDEIFACFSQDMTYIYFVSNNPGNNYGGFDIYRAEINLTYSGDLKGINIENLGENINSEYDEIALSFDEFDTKMYVVSNNEKSIGGFDIFKSIYLNNDWTKIENLGYPINTSKDEVYLSSLKDDNNLYVTVLDSKNDVSIKKAEFLDIDKNLITKRIESNLMIDSFEYEKSLLNFKGEIPINSYVMNNVSGVILDADTKEPLSVKVDIVDNKTLENIASFTTQSKTGRYSIALPSGATYGLLINDTVYLFCPTELTLVGTSIIETVNKDFYIPNKNSSKPIVLENISFVKDSDFINDEKSKGEIFRILKVLRDNENLKLIIIGQEDRASAIIKNLNNSGISMDRLIHRFPQDEFDKRISIRFIDN